VSDVEIAIDASARKHAPLEVAVVDSIDGLAVIHAMSARVKFLKGWWTK
jgi:hypothetical protein